MRKSVLSFSVAAAFAVPTLVLAQATPPAPTVPGNVTIASEYRFRGIDQTNGKPAIQGGLDYSHSSGFYVGNWNSNVSSGAGFPGGNVEMDFYGGFKKSFGDIGTDVGFLYYYYPGTSPKIDNKEVYVGASWKWISAKVFYALSDYFDARSPAGETTKGTYYLDLSGTYDLGGGFGVTAHYGRLKMKNFSDASYSDWKLGVTKDVSGWILGAAYIGTNAKGDCGAGEFYCLGSTLPSDAAVDQHRRNGGRDTIVLTVGKTF
jgi:uncharacterized protein (TIGR02001 family)